MLHELVLVLAGYGTSLDEKNFSHPSEYHIFQQAQVFGAKFRKITTTNSMLKDTLEIIVVKPVFDVLIETERAALAGSMPLTQIMTTVPRQFGALVDFTIELIDSRLNNSELRAVLAYQSVYGSDPDCKHLAKSCLSKLDSHWLDRLRFYLISGDVKDASDLIHYFGFFEPARKDLEEVLLRVSQFEPLKLTDPAMMKGTQKIVDSLSLLELPLDSDVFVSTLKSSSQRMNRLVMDYMSRTVNLTAVLALLRKVVLLGSGHFCIALEECHGEFLSALDQYEMEWARDDASDDVHKLARKLLTWTPHSETQWGDFSALCVGRLEFRHVEWPLTVLIDTRHVAVYTTIHEYLSAIHTTLTRIRRGSHKSIQHRALLCALWQWFQDSCEKAFGSVCDLVKSETQDVATEHGKVLKQLIRDLMLDSPEFRGALWTYLNDAQHEMYNVGALRSMRDALQARGSSFLAFLPPNM